eukprot:5055885-Amphidinium_carterae.4
MLGCLGGWRDLVRSRMWRLADCKRWDNPAPEQISVGVITFLRSLLGVSLPVSCSSGQELNLTGNACISTTEVNKNPQNCEKMNQASRNSLLHRKEQP